MISKKIKQKLIKEYVAGGRSYRELEEVYGVPASTLHRWVVASGLERVPDKEPVSDAVGGLPEKAGNREMRLKRSSGLISRPVSKPGRSSGSEPRAGETQAVEIKRLRRELDEARLYGRLMEAMIEIAEEEFEIPIRKKSGAKR